MKLSLNWIKEFVTIPEGMDINKLMYDLTMSTVEVEKITKLADLFDNIVVGEIKEILDHPNADKLRVCKTDIGMSDMKDIVCGGSNLKKGMKVAVACPGAMVRWHGEGESVKIKKTKLRGVSSFGMICASSEIGLTELFPANDDHEIIDLSDFNVEPGTPIAKALDLNDIIIEIDNKSMTNRPDLWSHYGIAREIAAIYDLPFDNFDKYILNTKSITDTKSIVDTKKIFDVRIEDVKKCQRYICVTMEGLNVKPSPFEIQCKIWKLGIRPINALVDITNYVMLALGQPMHVFDFDKVSNYISVRSAKSGEKVKLINDKEISLCEGNLVIADSKNILALAGIMGGAQSAVSLTTNKIILEIANFNSLEVRKTAICYDNRTESSSRYEKSIDPQRCDLALSLVMKLFCEIYPEAKIITFNDLYPNKLESKEFDVNFKWLNKRLGKKISKTVIEKKLSIMGFKLTFYEKGMHVVVPSWRSTGDVSIKEDIVEEIARMYGYENFELTPITSTFDCAINQREIDIVRKVKEYLACSCNMSEIFTYPWVSEEYISALFKEPGEILELSDPPSQSEKYIRSSVLPNICQAIAKNEKYFEEFNIFEEAQVFFDREYTSFYEDEKLPCQQRRLGCAFVGKSDKIPLLFRQAKGVIENMPVHTHMEKFILKKALKPFWADDVVWENIYVGEKKIGDIALLSRTSSINCGIKFLSAILVELNMDDFKLFKARENHFVHLPIYPLTNYDISFLVSSELKWEEIKGVLKDNKSNLLKDVLFVEEYKGKQIPEGMKSITIRLVIGSDEKTLTSKEIESVVEKTINKLAKNLNIKVREK